MTTTTLEACTPPRGVFNGRNFMTPDYVACYRRQMRGRTVFIEISEGRGMSGQPIYGATFRYADGSMLHGENEKDPSTCFRSKREVIEHARNAE